MFQFDESFLEQVGLSNMPQEQKDNFLQYAQDQLEVRIGEKMSEDLSEAQLDEFEKIIDNDQETVQKWLAQLGDYQNDETFIKLKEDADMDINPAERDLGGMGIFIVKNIMNEVTYQRLEGKNLLTMKKEIVK